MGGEEGEREMEGMEIWKGEEGRGDVEEGGRDWVRERGRELNC